MGPIAHAGDARLACGHSRIHHSRLGDLCQHFVFHPVPWLWRLHRVHHADFEIDVTTGVRFHPIEVLLSLRIKLATFIVFGIPALAVMVFEIALNGTRCSAMAMSRCRSLDAFRADCRDA